MKIQFLLLLFFIGSSLSSQTIELGPEEKGSRKDVISDIILSDDTGIYALRTAVRFLSYPTPIIEKYTVDFAQVYSVRLTEFDQSNLKAQSIFPYNDRIFIALSERDKSAGRAEFYIQEIDKSTGKLTGARKKIGANKLEKRISLPNLTSRISRDKSKLAMFINEFALFGSGAVQIFNLPIGKKDDTYGNFTLKVFDDNLSEIWSKKVKLPYNNDRLSVLEFDTDNDGNIYLLTRYRPEDWRAKRKAKKPFFTYKILAYRNDGADVEEYDVTLENKYISDITFDLGKDDNLMCGGFFSDKFNGALGGTFFFTIDADTKKIIQQDTKKFGTEELSLFMSKRKAEKGKEISSDFSLDEFILRSDGGIVLIGESYYETTITSTGPNGRSSTTTYYHYGPILVVNVSPAGKIDWVTKIDKNQDSSTKAYSSYETAVVKDKIYFVFNKGIRKKSNVMAVSVDAGGKVSEQELFQVKDEKLLLRVPGCEQVSDDEMVVYGEWRKKFRFGKIKF